MKNVLLVNPLISDFAAYDLWLHPFGLEFIEYIIRKHTGFNVYYIDFLRVNKDLYPAYYKKKIYGQGKFHKTHLRKVESCFQDQYSFYSLYGMPENIITDALLKLENIDIILITSLMSYWYEGVMHSISILRKTLGNLPVVVGGMWPIQYPVHSQKMLGKTEDCHVINTPDLNQLLKLFKSLRLIEHSDKIDIYKEFREFSQQEIPGYIDFSPVITSLGCPFSCAFCLSPVMHRHNCIQRNYDNVIKDILKGALMNKDIVFFDDALLHNKEKHIKPVLYELARRGIRDSRFHLPNGLNTSLLDEELAFLLKKLNFTTIRLSVEGFDTATMQYSNKKINYSRFIEVLNILENAGIERSKTGFYLLFGLPGQDFDELREFAVEYAKKGYYVGLSELTPVPGTEVFDLLKGNNPEISQDPININNSTFIHNFMDISEKFFRLKKEIRSIRMLNN